MACTRHTYEHSCWFAGYRYGLAQGYGGWRNVCYLGNALMAMPYYAIGRYVVGLLPAVEAWFAHHRPVAFGLAVALAGMVSVAVHYNGGVSMFCILFGRQPFPLNVLWCYGSGFCGTLMVLLHCRSPVVRRVGVLPASAWGPHR